MLLKRDRGEEPEHPAGPGPMGNRGKEESHRYRMRQKLVSSGDDYWIENALRQRFDVHVAGANDVLILAITVIIDMMID